MVGFSPKSSILIGFSDYKPSILGFFPPIFGNTQIVVVHTLMFGFSLSLSLDFCTNKNTYNTHYIPSLKLAAGI